MPYLNYQTYYRIVGDITKPALVLLHGGPGSTHNYFELLDSLASDDYCIVMTSLVVEIPTLKVTLNYGHLKLGSMS